jgi:hypothetical protein
LWSFSLDRRNRPAFALVMQVMSHIAEGYETHPRRTRDALERANEDIVAHIGEVDAALPDDSGTTRYTELFRPDMEAGLTVADPNLVRNIHSTTPSLPGRTQMLGFAMRRIAELLPQAKRQQATEQLSDTDDILARIDEALAEHSEDAA